jgi:hypothetical protein
MSAGIADVSGFKVEKAKLKPPRRDPTLSQPTGKDESTMSQEAEVEIVSPVEEAEGTEIKGWEDSARTGKLVEPLIDSCSEGRSSTFGSGKTAAGKLT